MAEERREPKIGMWYANCCELDLYEIKTQDDIDYILDLREDDIDVAVLEDTRDQALLMLGLNPADHPSHPASGSQS
jgi:hypothetical protein